METAAEPTWVSLKDEELLALRICDLGVRLPGSELEPRVNQLFEDLAARGVTLRPDCYLGDEWFSPEAVPAIAMPFFLAHPRLKALEMHLMMEVEGGTPDWCQKLLRHECGHAVNHAYKLSDRKDWQMVFGSPETEYTPETYTPRPYSKSFVQHLPNWYAQAHPEEDFSETFAVWLGGPPEEWRAKYRGWKALDKLEYVNEIMTEAASMRVPRRPAARRIAEASRMQKTLGRYYAERRKKYAEDYPDVYDRDLHTIFGGEASEESAARFLRKARKTIVPTIVRWTGEHKYTVDHLVRRLMLRCERLQLMAPQNQTRLMMDVSAYVAALVTNHLHTGRFKRFV